MLLDHDYLSAEVRAAAARALPFAREGFAPDTAAAWYPVAAEPSVALALSNAGYTPTDITDIVEASDAIVSAVDMATELVNEWLPLGLPVDRVRTAIATGYSTEEIAAIGGDHRSSMRLVRIR